MKLGTEIDKNTLIYMFRQMLRIRYFEENVVSMFTKGRIPGWIHIYAGEEAIAVGACTCLRKEDYITSTHRCHGHMIAKGVPMKKVAAEIYGKVTGCNKGKGGSMHVMDVSSGVLGANAIVGAGIPIAVGAGLTIKRKGIDRVVLCFFGDGALNTGAFHEGINMAAILEVPVIFLCENNEYGYSVPQESTMKVDVVTRGGSYGLPAVSVDGSDVVEVYKAVKEAVERARAGEGPTFIEAKAVRLRGHYEGDPENYITEDYIRKRKEKDPIPKMTRMLIDEGILREEDVARIKEEVRREVDEAFRFAEESPYPEPEEALEDVYPGKSVSVAEEVPAGERVITYREAVREALRQAMLKDEAVFLLGEDIGKLGGAEGVTVGLQDEFGPERVMDTPISETAIIGVAIGAAITGMRPVAEIMYSSFLGVCMDQIYNQAAKLPYISGGQICIPIVIRTVNLSGFSAAAQHEERNEVWFMHTPGIKVVLPSTPYDAKGLLLASIWDDNPVIFFEHGALYPVKGPVPEKEYMIELGKADVKREGEDVTVVSYSWFVQKALKAADMLEKEGISVEVVDLRTLTPLDKKTIIESVKKTGRVVVFEEDVKTAGVGAEISATIVEEAFDYLDAPIKRVAALDTPTPFSPPLLEYVIPAEDDLIRAVKEVVGYTF